jgi:hypothetical protein
MFEASWSTEDGMTSFWNLLVVIFDMGVHSCRRGLQELPGDKRMKAHRAQVLDCPIAAKEINNLERS